MDIAVKKIELIEWLTRLQDERIIQRIEALRTNTATELYQQQMPKNQSDLLEKIERSEKDIEAGSILAQEAVEHYFKSKFNNNK
jgi:hypothetical protein